MKKITACLFLLVTVISAQSQTADEILAKYEAAAGGREKLEAVRSLEVESALKMSVMGQAIDLPLTLVREKGKLFRRQIGGIMGMGESYTVITDTAGYFFIPAIPGFRDQPGTPASVSKIKTEELASQQYELDCAGAFGELVNYAAKGHTAELLGTEKVNKVVCHKIRMKLKTGQSITYFIDGQTFLVKQVEALGEMAANLTGFGGMMKAFGRDTRKDKATMNIKEYQEVNGIKYPFKLSLGLGAVESEVENTSIKINEAIDEKWYKVGKA